ncbi:MAG: hypothetical protein Q8M78_12130, partial [Burkholderiaceae bacterium]|nr:hypothetical protein [Burkholderiaceae bacterium]
MCANALFQAKGKPVARLRDRCTDALRWIFAPNGPNELLLSLKYRESPPIFKGISPSELVSGGEWVHFESAKGEFQSAHALAAYQVCTKTAP